MSKPFSFEKAGLQRRLTLSMMFTSIVPIVLLTLAFFIYEYISVRDSLVSDLTTKAEIVGANCNGALAFDNATDATQTLEALSSQPHILTGAIFDKAGKLFASYR